MSRTDAQRQSVVLVDDEPLARANMRRLIKARPDLKLVGEAGSGTAALELMTTDAEARRPDVLLLDIEMPGMDGFQLLNELSQRGLTPASIVFVTAYNRYAVRAFETQAIDYLVKPVTPERFAAAVDRATGRQHSLSRSQVKELLADALVAPPERLLVRKGQRIVPVDVADISWIEASGDYVKLHCGDAYHLIERTLAEMEKLLEVRGFRRIHRSALVNEACIEGMAALGSGRYELNITGGTRLVVSRTYSGRLREGLL